MVELILSVFLKSKLHDFFQSCHNLGTQVYYLLGKIVKNYMSGRAWVEVVRNPNPNPEKCNTETGVTFLISRLTTSHATRVNLTHRGV
jgi:hypothetical protein